MAFMSNAIPGRWVEGLGLILGPPLLLAGLVVRAGEDDFYPGQLVAYAGRPGRMAVSYGLFSAGLVFLWPAVMGLGRRIGATHPGWAAWGGTLAVFGLFGRVFHAGAGHMAFQMVDALGAEA